MYHCLVKKNVCKLLCLKANAQYLLYYELFKQIHIGKLNSNWWTEPSKENKCIRNSVCTTVIHITVCKLCFRVHCVTPRWSFFTTRAAAIVLSIKQSLIWKDGWQVSDMWVWLLNIPPLANDMVFCSERIANVGTTCKVHLAVTVQLEEFIWNRREDSAIIVNVKVLRERVSCHFKPLKWVIWKFVINMEWYDARANLWNTYS